MLSPASLSTCCQFLANSCVVSARYFLPLTHCFWTTRCLPRSVLTRSYLLSLILWLGTIFADRLHTWPGFTVSGPSVCGYLLGLLFIDSATSSLAGCFPGHTLSALPRLYCLTFKDSFPSMSEICLFNLVFKDAGHLCQQSVYLASCQCFCFISATRLSTRPRIKDYRISGGRLSTRPPKDSVSSLLPNRLHGLTSRILLHLCWQDIYSASCQGLCLIFAGRLPTWSRVKD